MQLIDMLTTWQPLPREIRKASDHRYMAGHANNGASRFDPKINRHTGQPHLHLRERARNLGVEQSTLTPAPKPKRVRKPKAA